MVIAIDFDGTITDSNIFPRIGKVREHCSEAIHNLQQKGHSCVLWTCRNDIYLDEAVQFCKENNINFDMINDSPYKLDSRKIIADIYIDDKNVFSFDTIDWYKIEQYILNYDKTKQLVSLLYKQVDKWKQED